MTEEAIHSVLKQRNCAGCIHSCQLDDKLFCNSCLAYENIFSRRPPGKLRNVVEYDFICSDFSDDVRQVPPHHIFVTGRINS